jgi:hypothetical protein
MTQATHQKRTSCLESACERSSGSSDYATDGGIALSVEEEAMSPRGTRRPIARTYRFKVSSMKSQSDFHGYGSVGGQVTRSGLGARLELRDYVSRFKRLPGDTETSSTRNDLMLTGAVTFPL